MLPAQVAGAPPRHERVEVVYVTGDGRSGSTLLSRLLGQTPGWCSVGEVRYVWERGLAQDRLCECGARFSACPFWTQVVDRAFGSVSAVPVPELVRAENRLLRTRRALSTLRGAKDPGAWLAGEPTYARSIAALYPAIRDVAGCQVVVDSSKLPAYAQVLRGTAGVRVSVVHLVRDPRATAHSWRRLKRLQEGDGRAWMRQQGLLRSCAVWSASNVLAERLLHDADAYVRVRYEDLLADPTAALHAVSAALGLPGEVITIADGSAHLAPGHAVAGNPDRHRSGPVRLRLDDAWRTEMSGRDAALVGAVTTPLRRRYGYV